MPIYTFLRFSTCTGHPTPLHQHAPAQSLHDHDTVAVKQAAALAWSFRCPLYCHSSLPSSLLTPHTHTGQRERLAGCLYIYFVAAAAAAR